MLGALPAVLTVNIVKLNCQHNANDGSQQTSICVFCTVTYTVALILCQSVNEFILDPYLLYMYI